MSTNFPASLDTLSNPAATDGLTGHASQHANANDAIEALQTKVGADGSSDAASLDYKVAELNAGKMSVDATTDAVAEGAANLYFTAQRVRDVVLTGLSTATNAVITAADTVLGALGKLQKQISDNLSALTAHTGSTSNPHAVTKAQVGLGSVDNTSDMDKPVSDAQAAAIANIAAASYGMFYKADPTTVAFTKTGAGTASIKAGTKVDVAGAVVTFVGATAIAMPALTAGTDYAIWVKDDATIQATTNFSTAPGAGNWRKIGGFHYAPGGNAAAVAGGDTTPAINAYSLWDLKFRPACPDPRGMALVADSFWSDIYLLGADHLTNGTSKYSVTIADGSSPPKIPTKFGGNGSTAYSTMNWWEANEVLQSWGKRSPTYDEFAALAYGTTEATSSSGSDVPTTGVSGTGATNAWNKFTSRWGVIQATGCMWIWGGEFGGGAASAAWTANTGGRGSTYQMENAVLFGGAWGHTSSSGSRASVWNNSPTNSYNHIGTRGVCSHYVVD